MVYIKQYPDISASKIRELANKCTSRRSYERYLAIALILEGNKANEIAKTIGKSYKTILNWVTIYNDEGIEKLAYNAPPGNKSFLTDEQFNKLRLAVLKSPKEVGIDSIQWTYKELIRFIEREFSITIKERTAQKYFNKMGFVRKKPKQQYARSSYEKKENSMNI